MLEEAARCIPQGASLLDAGCGIGLLTEHLSNSVEYAGLDISSDFIAICNERYGKKPSHSFQVADLNAADFGRNTYDVVTLLNTLNLPDVNAVATLRKTFDALSKGGRIVVSGPTGRDSFNRAEPSILAQLEQDGHMAGNEGKVQALREANARILTERGNYWSAEGMVALLKHLGFASIVTVNKELYYGCAYLVVAEK
jgi:ubiquinone/menaquinone biosynthesis C-methylase UbiE